MLFLICRLCYPATFPSVYINSFGSMVIFIVILAIYYDDIKLIYL